MGKLDGKCIAVVMTDGVEQVEYTEPVRALKAEGATVDVIAPKTGSVQAMKHLEKGDQIPVDLSIDQANPARYDGLLVPGGVANPDRLRMDEQVVGFVRAIAQRGVPMGVICHGPWILVEAGIVNGRTLTSWPSLQTDIRNAGGNWVDREVVVDNGLVTSRKPDDIAAFTAKLIEELLEGRHDLEGTAHQQTTQQVLDAFS